LATSLENKKEEENKKKKKKKKRKKKKKKKKKKKIKKEGRKKNKKKRNRAARGGGGGKEGQSVFALCEIQGKREGNLREKRRRGPNTVSLSNWEKKKGKKREQESFSLS